MGASKDCTDAHVIVTHCENLAGAMKLKQQILGGSAGRQVEILSCRGLTSFYAMQKA